MKPKPGTSSVINIPSIDNLKDMRVLEREREREREVYFITVMQKTIQIPIVN